MSFGLFGKINPCYGIQIHMDKRFDVVILGAGGAGLMCALQASKRGKKVALVDHSKKPGAKILISGGGRCNFTNLKTSSQNFASQNPDFCKTALSKFQPKDFVKMVIHHKIKFHEKKLGQLFCDHSAREIVKMLVDECEHNHVEFFLDTKISHVAKLEHKTKEDPRFEVTTSSGDLKSNHLVVATGGLSFPKIGATNLGFEIAKQFGHSIIETAPALDGFVLTDPQTKTFCELSGVSLDCKMSVANLSFRENLLFTHVGISGPAALQCSLHWRPGMFIGIDLLPTTQIKAEAKKCLNQKLNLSLKKLLETLVPIRFASLFCDTYLSGGHQKLNELNTREWDNIESLIHCWKIKPSSTVGYHKAEVTRGGVNTLELSPKTLQSKIVPGLFFIGEVVDVTGWLGGFNFQWAWASGYCAAQAF